MVIYCLGKLELGASIMELDMALDLLRFTGLWPLKEKKSLCSKLICIRAAVSRFFFVIIMTLIIIKWWTPMFISNDEIYINVARSSFILLREYISIMFFYKKRKLIQQLIWRCTGDFPAFDLCEEYVTIEAAMRQKLKKRLRFYGILVFLIWVTISISAITFGVIGSFTVSEKNRFLDVNITSWKANDQQYLVFDTWWPDEEFNSYSYYAVFAMQCSFLFHVSLGISAVDNFIFSILLATKERISMIKHTAAIAFKHSVRGSPENGNNKVFQQWLDYRIHMKKVVEDINNVLGGILYLSISNCVVAITLLSYVISLVPEQTIPRYAIIIAAFLIETLVFCLVGQGIIREGQKLCDEVQDQVRACLKKGAIREGCLADTVQILLTDCTEEMLPFIDVKGIYKLSLPLFFKLLYSCFGYVTTLLQFRQSKQN